MALRRRKPNLDERFNLPEDTDVDDVLRRLLEADGSDTTVSEDLEEDSEEG